MSINRQEFTNAGRTILGRANNGEHLTISKIVIGAGRAGQSSALWPLTELLDYKMDGVITQKIDQGNGILLIDCGFNSSTAPGAFDLCEVGVMARIDNEPERIYSVANVLATGADHVDPNVESIHAFKLKVVIDRATNITVVIGDSTDILAENIGAETVGPGWFKEKIANTLRFKRVVQGTGIELLETADTVRISQKILEADLNLYVSNGNNNVSPNFSTIQNAHDYLLQFYIPNNRVATINVLGERFYLAQPVNIYHPQGAQIRIIGALPNTRNIVGAGNLNGTVDNYSLVVPVDDTTGIAVNDLVCIQGGVEWLMGAWRVQDVVGNLVNLHMVIASYNIPVGNYPQLIGPLLVVFPTQIFAPTDAFQISSGDLGFLDRIAICGSGAANSNGIVITRQKELFIGGILINRFFYGLNSSSGQVNAISLYICGCNDGLTGDSGANYIISSLLVINGMQNFGLWLSSTATIRTVGFLYIIGVWFYGILVESMALATIGSASFLGFNGEIGFGAVMMTSQKGILRSGVGSRYSYHFNHFNAWHLVAYTTGLIDLINVSGVDPASVFPANNTLGLDGAYIRYSAPPFISQHPERNLPPHLDRPMPLPGEADVLPTGES